MPSVKPGINISQMPEDPNPLIIWLRPSQKLKSPTTDTLLAAGAQTEKEIPLIPSTVIKLAPNLL